jgi:hypothetical protein
MSAPGGVVGPRRHALNDSLQVVDIPPREDVRLFPFIFWKKDVYTFAVLTDRAAVGSADVGRRPGALRIAINDLAAVRGVKRPAAGVEGEAVRAGLEAPLRHAVWHAGRPPAIIGIGLYIKRLDLDVIGLPL